MSGRDRDGASAREVDLIIVGAGVAGMTAAIRAADLGLTVEVVEASPLIGGVAAVSGGFVWVGNNSLSKEAGLGDSWQAVDTYLDGLAGGLETDRPLRDAITRAASRMLDYLRDRAGIEMHVCERQDMHHPQMPGSASSGRTVEFVEHGHRIDRKTRALLRPSYHFRDGLMQHEIYRAGGKVSAYRKLGGLLEQRRNSDVLTMGPGLVGALARAAFTDRGVDYRVETALTDLSLFPDGSVEAHLVDGEGRTERRRAGAVLLAIGSYGHHADAAAIEGLPTLTEQSPRILRGDLFRLSEQVGAGLVRRGRLYLSLGFRNENPQSQDEPEVIQVYDTLGLPHTILVNRDGRRFADENAYPAVMEGTLQFDSTSNRHRNIPAYFIADRRFREKGGFPSLEEWPEKSMVEAASLEELAGMLGIDASGFVAEVADFNRSCAAGEQPVFGRGATAFGRLNNSNRTQGNGSEAFLAPLDEPPFYGVEVLPAAAGIYPLGFRVEPETARVLRQDGQTVPAIYAAGNLVAYGDLPGAYEGGYANARGMALAFLAAEDVARRLGQQGG